MLQGEFAGEADGLGNVVEIVSDATGKTPDGFHAMGVAELLLNLTLAGNVEDVSLNV